MPFWHFSQPLPEVFFTLGVVFNVGLGIVLLVCLGVGLGVGLVGGLVLGSDFSEM